MRCPEPNVLSGGADVWVRVGAGAVGWGWKAKNELHIWQERETSLRDGEKVRVHGLDIGGLGLVAALKILPLQCLRRIGRGHPDSEPESHNSNSIHNNVRRKWNRSQNRFECPHWLIATHGRLYIGMDRTHGTTIHQCKTTQSESVTPKKKILCYRGVLWNSFLGSQTLDTTFLLLSRKRHLMNATRVDTIVRNTRVTGRGATPAVPT